MYTTLQNQLKLSNIYTETFDESHKSFGAQTIDIIIYFNNEKKEVSIQHPHGNIEKLIETLFEICETSPLIKTKKKFIFDDPKKGFKK